MFKKNTPKKNNKRKSFDTPNTKRNSSFPLKRRKREPITIESSPELVNEVIVLSEEVEEHALDNEFGDLELNLGEKEESVVEKESFQINVNKVVELNEVQKMIAEEFNKKGKELKNATNLSEEVLYKLVLHASSEGMRRKAVFPVRATLSGRSLWMGNKKFQYESPILRITEEIDNLVIWCSENSEEKRVRDRLEGNLKKWLKKQNIGKFSFQRIGSSRTGIALPCGDMDFTLLLDKTNRFSSTPLKAMKKLARNITESKERGEIIFGSFQFVKNATIPVLKFTDLNTTIPVDISFGSKQAVNNADNVTAFFERFPCAKDLTIVLKILLINNHLNDSFRGGLSSFPLVGFIVSFFQNYSNSIKPDLQKIEYFEERNSKEMNEIPSGLLLTDFLYYYGNLFNYTLCGIDLEKGMLIEKGSVKRINKYGVGPYLFTQGDKSFKKNAHVSNAARNLRRTEELRNLFKESYFLLKRQNGKSSSILANIICIEKLHNERKECKSIPSSSPFQNSHQLLSQKTVLRKNKKQK